MYCIKCNNKLNGKQKMYCSILCKSQMQNNKNQSYEKQQKRAKERKLKAIEIKGGKCKYCGYNKNLSALVFHHLINKDFGLDGRKFSNTSWEKILLELDKCELVCHNCHMEIHYPQNML
jgi:5-methylcytosine-specific restriction endonuclease McrA